MKLFKNIETIIEKKFLVIFLIVVLIPFVFAIKTIATGEISFWYDPARDLLLAWSNLSKPTLIGPPSGIPGIFYGVYWIWLLSIGLLVSKDPRVVDLIVLTIPYFIFFPILLLTFSKIFNKVTLIILWLLFILGFSNYATQIWNIHPAPLLFVLLIYLLVLVVPRYEKNKKRGFILLSGIICGLIVNFDISFGLGVFVGTTLYLCFIECGIKDVKRIVNFMKLFQCLSLYALGICIAFIPFFIFELKHGFQQIRVIVSTILSSSPVVGQIGLTKIQIIQNFIERFGTLLEISNMLSYGLFIVFGFLLMLVVKARKENKNRRETKLIFLMVFVSISLLFIYLTTKNPVWGYHFIGIELLFLFLLGVICNRFLWIRMTLLCWVCFLLATQSLQFLSSFYAKPYQHSSLMTKEHIVEIILSDGKEKSYTVFAYYPAIYTFDYDYLFKEKANKEIGHTPSDIKENMRSIYLIIPDAGKSNNDGFIYYITPKTKYKTSYSWNIPDGTTILRRDRIK